MHITGSEEEFTDEQWEYLFALADERIDLDFALVESKISKNALALLEEKWVEKRGKIPLDIIKLAVKMRKAAREVEAVKDKTQENVAKLQKAKLELIDKLVEQGLESDVNDNSSFERFRKTHLSKHSLSSGDIDLIRVSIEAENGAFPTSKDHNERGWLQVAQPVASRGRRIVVFCDGTWNTPEELASIKDNNLMNPPPITNVVRLLRSVVTDDRETDIPQVIGYFRGVGTDGFLPSRIIDGATGHGLARIVLDAYRFICHNLEWRGPGTHSQVVDDEVFIFGFSRGAYAARALNGFLSRFGLIKKDSLWLLPFFFDKYMRMLSNGEPLDTRTDKLWRDNVHPEYQSIKVKFLGVWDTVGALGVPVKGISWFTKDYHAFFNTDLTPNVSHAFQALAIHEMRRPFKPVFWTGLARANQVVEQAWFAGAHSNVGGGYRRTGLSSHALDWLAYKAYRAGLRVDLNYLIQEIKTRNSEEQIALSRKKGHGERGFINQRNIYRRLSRPVEISKIQAYLDTHFNGQRMSSEVQANIKVHWSIDDRPNGATLYTDDQEHFTELDRQAKTLARIARTETLLLEP